MSTWLIALVSGWIGLGIGMAGTAYILLTARFMDDAGQIHLERNITPPADWLRELAQR